MVDATYDPEVQDVLAEFNDEWRVVADALHRGWPRQFDAEDLRAFVLLLGDVAPADALVAIRQMVAQGRARYRPSVGEIGAAVHASKIATDAAPSWTEAEGLIFGRGGILAARLPSGVRFAGPTAQRDMEAAREQAMLHRAEETHPVVAAFVRSKGALRLAREPLDDAEYGALRRAELAKDYREFCSAAEKRQAAGLPIALPAPGGPRQLGDGLAAVLEHARPASQIEEAARS